MHGNKYDTDVTVWSPEGKLHQVKYATEAEKQGSACCGIRTNKYVVLGAFRRRPNELASYQRKIVEIDTHMGIAMSGLTADARALSKYMRTECMDHEYVYGRKMPMEMLVRQVAEKEHFCTLTYERRPYGVGLLIGGVDSKGPHLFHTSPSGEYLEYSACAIGSRSQSAKTALSRRFLNEETNVVTVSDDLTIDELINIVLDALKGCVQGDSKLTKENCSVAVVGVDLPFRELSEEEIAPYVNALTQWIVCLREMRERNWGGFNSDRRMGCGSKWMKEMVFSLIIDLHLEVVCFLRYSLVIRFKSNHSLKPSSHSGSQNSFEYLMCIEQTQQ